MPSRRLVLASTSRYRSELLQRLRLPFTVRAPGVDESARPGEAPRDLAWRLALAKAETLGIALLDAIESDDPTALIGLPLIRTSALLRRAGIDPLAGPAPVATAGGAAR